MLFKLCDKLFESIGSHCWISLFLYTAHVSPPRMPLTSHTKLSIYILDFLKCKFVVNNFVNIVLFWQLIKRCGSPTVHVTFMQLCFIMWGRGVKKKMPVKKKKSVSNIYVSNILCKKTSQFKFLCSTQIWLIYKKENFKGKFSVLLKHPIGR